MAQPKKRPVKGKRPPKGREDLGEEKKTPGKFQKAFFWIIIPLLFASAILLIVFGIIDFATAVFSSKEDDMKKRRETFIKRIVAAVLVFLAPILVNLLLNIANDAWNWINPDTCLK